jgi:adenylate cyclase
MIRLQLLGSIELRRDGAEVRSVLSQPKRLGLLAYLASVTPQGSVSRDRLLALFWPEADTERARSSLRQALHFLRRSLGEDALVARTDHEVGIDPDVLWCDARAFDEAIAGGRLEEALELYRGEFLPAFFVEEAPEVERWVEEERSRRRRAALDAAWRLVAREQERGELRAAAMWARRGLAIDPLDEGSLRRLLELLERGGEPAAAVEAFREFSRRLELELSLEPSAETLQQIDRIRSPAPRAPSAAPLPGPRREPREEPVPLKEPPEPAAGRAEHSARAAPGPRRSRGLTRFAAAIAVLFLLPAGWWALRPVETSATADDFASIAVLPFLNLSGDPANDYFSDGISEELLNVLAQVPELRVASRTASFAFRGSGVPLDSIARVLRVRHVLEGSVRKDGDRIRITAQLIEVGSGYHLWSRNYDRTFREIFTVQDEISRAIADQLRVELARSGPEGRPETLDPEAYAMMLKANFVFNQAKQSPRERYASASAFLEQAIELDPEYAQAYAKLAEATQMQAYRSLIPADSGYARARQLAKRALELDPSLWRPHRVLATIAEFYDWDFETAERHYRRSLDLWPAREPPVPPHAFLLIRMGRTEEGIAAARRAAELQPDWPGAHNNLAAVYSMARRYDDALRAYETALALSADNPSTLLGLAYLHVHTGQPERGVEYAERARALIPDDSYAVLSLAYCYARAGRASDARQLLAGLDSRSDASAYQRARVHVALGEHDRAFRLLNQAIDGRDAGAPGLDTDEGFDAIRGDPRMADLRTRIGLK